MNHETTILDFYPNLQEQIDEVGFAIACVECEDVKNETRHKLAYTIGFSFHNAPELIIADADDDDDDDDMMEFLQLAFHQVSHFKKFPPQSIIQCKKSCFKLLEPASFITGDFTAIAQDYFKEKAPQLLDFNMLYVSSKDRNGLFEDEKPFSETPYNNTPLFQMPLKVCTSNN